MSEGFENPLNEVDKLSITDSLEGGKGALQHSSVNRQWLQNRPPPREPPRPPSPPKPFSGTPQAIARNDALIHSLKVAPNVLFERFQQFGQVGVLGWCAEFEELIDELKSLGFSGEMASETRETALKACKDVLRLHLDIQIQLILMYLSGQVARLRKFLGQDGDTDYPLPDFPMPPGDEY